MSYLIGPSSMPQGESRVKNYFQRNSVINFNHITELLKVKQDLEIISSISLSERSDLSNINLITKRKSISPFKENIKEPKQLRCEHLRHKLKMLDTLLIFLSISGLLCAIYNFEYNFTGDSEGGYRSTKMDNYIKMSTSITTGFCLCIVFYRSYISYQLKREKKVIFRDKLKGFFNSSCFITLITDISILIIHPLPRINFRVEFEQLDGMLHMDFNSICFSFMTLRFVFLLRIFLHYSKWSSLKVQTICKENGVGHPIIFALKACLHDRPHYILIPTFAISTLAFGIILQVYEKPFNQDNSKFADGNASADYSYLYNSMWLIVLTLTTVGFGDYFPRTHVGRFIIIFTIIWGTFLFSLVIIMLNNYVQFTRPQEKSFKYFKKLTTYKEVQQSAKKLIGAAVVLNVYKKYRKVPESDPMYKQKVQEILHFRCLFRVKMNELMFKSPGVRDCLVKLNETLGLDLNRLQKMLEYAISLEGDLDSIIESQKKTLEILLNCLKFSKDSNRLLRYSII